jgi:hypothetical protein
MISNNKALLTPRSAPNVDEGIESDSTMKQKNNDESIVYGAEGSPCNIGSVSTTQTDKDESVFDTNNAVGGPSNGSLILPENAWILSELRVGGGDPTGIISTNIWLDNKEGKDWLGRIEREKIILQSIHNIYGSDEVKRVDNKVMIDCCNDAHSPITTLHILKRRP